MEKTSSLSSIKQPRALASSRISAPAALITLLFTLCVWAAAETILQEICSAVHKKIGFVVVVGCFSAEAQQQVCM